jgi:hypothetical protein
MKLLAFLLLFSATVFAKPAAKQFPSRWHELMHLTSQEIKILESAKNKNANLQYRLLELYSERLKLIHEKNNKEFLAKSPKNPGIPKEAYFKETRNDYLKTRNYGISILKDNPGTPRRAEILFALALNSRDYGRDNITEKYLLETIALIKDPNNAVRHHAETALADHYYNEKKFAEAIKFYERVIKKTNDEWLPKHLLNLSWCYLKQREFDKAIVAMRMAYARARDKKYVNIKDQVLDNIGSFYVWAGRPLEGMEFYLKYEGDPVPYLIPLAQKASEKGHQKETETILNNAQKIVKDKKLWKHQEELFHSYLDFYRHYNRFADHERVSKQLVGYYQQAANPKLKLKQDMKDDAVEKLRSVAGFLQIKLAKDMKEDEQRYKTQDLEIVLSYFGHLITLDPKRKHEYLYFRAETFYAVRRFTDAAPNYVECTKHAKEAKNLEYARKALNSLLALTGQEIIEKNLNNKYLIFAYTEHVTLWPKDEKSEKIYPKLFELHRFYNDDDKAIAVLSAYHKAYPEHLNHQQELMTKILDSYIEKKDTAKLAHWIHQFKAGFLKFSKAHIEKTENVLGSILFLQYQDIANKGDKLTAAKGFESIYQNKLYTDKIKAQSAFFAAMAYLEMGETATSYKWQALAYTKMTEEEKNARREEHLKIAERTYKLQDFVTAQKVSEFLLGKFCSKKDNIQKRFYEIAVMTALVEDNVTAAEQITKKYDHCISDKKSKQMALAQIYQFHERRGDFFGLKGFVARYPTNDFLTLYRYSLQKWYWEKSDLNLREQIASEYKSLKHPETLAWLKEIVQIEKAKADIAAIEASVIWDRPAFDGDAFNQSLEAHLLKVQKIKDNHQNLTQSTQVDLAILSTKLFASFYDGVGRSISSLSPKGIDPEIVKDFQGAMKQLADTFVNVSSQYEKQLSKALREKETMAWGARAIASVEDIENPVFSFSNGLTMDKGKD